MINLRLPSIALLVALAQVFPSSAQNSSTNDTSQCNQSYYYENLASEYATVNATGQTPIEWNVRIGSLNTADQPPWYLTMTINDTYRAENMTKVQRRSFLSIPNDVEEARVCILQFTYINATASGPGQDGCEGAISDTCLDYMRKKMTSNVPDGNLCLGPDFHTSDEQWEECRGFVSSILITTEVKNATNQTCTLSEIPGVSLPDNYHSFETPTYVDHYNSLPSVWDLKVHQTIPFGIVSTFYDRSSHVSDAKVVCVATNQVKDGSRVPSSEKPWETPKSSGAQSNWKASGISAVLFVGIAEAILTV